MLLTNLDFVRDKRSRNDLLEEVLIEPAKHYDELHIISGYSASAMLEKHYNHLTEMLSKDGRIVKIHLIVGMVPSSGVSYLDHSGYCRTVSESPGVRCAYMTGKSCHSKVYIWLKDGIPEIAFIGSANYSQSAFYDGSTVEDLHTCDPVSAEDFFRRIEGMSADCTDPSVGNKVTIGQSKDLKKQFVDMKKNPKADDTVRLSLVMTGGNRKGMVGDKSGLNWGQREGREPNQAYIPIPAGIAKSDFFPPKKDVFTVVTDDNEVFQCVTEGNARRGDGTPKQITTTRNNSELGLYFRKRLGLRPGDYVRTEDLERYGRTDVLFRKISSEAYLMDFSKPIKGKECLDD